MSWHIETNSMGKVVLICNDKGRPVARMVDDSDHASAALIAAAPELAESLELAMYRIKDMLQGDDGQAFKEARKWLPRLAETLAKAGIESPTDWSEV